ncbi:hypothetical protein TYRP_022755 [Tyrophagus putrescentiae]|nr:hypothetical protein TYRP_022755 [Tyrophagus putrescentiae]
MDAKVKGQRSPVQRYNGGEGGQLTFVRLKEAYHQAVRDQPALLQKLFHQFLAAAAVVLNSTTTAKV